MKRTDGGVDSADARAILGNLWGTDAPLTEQQFAVALRMNGETAATTVRHWEHGQKPMSGPVTLAVDMMLPPTTEQLDECVDLLGAAQVGRGDDAMPLADVLADAGFDVASTLKDLALVAALTLRRPPTFEAALGAQESERARHNQARYASFLDRQAKAAKKVPDPS